MLLSSDLLLLIGLRCFDLQRVDHQSPPFRNASAYLVLGENLFWVHDEWVVDMKIQKTRSHNPHHLVLSLAPDHGTFIDAILLGDCRKEELAERRAQAIAAR